MRVGMVGLGKLGLPCALAIESKGHEVIGYDVNSGIGNYIKGRKIPYLEKGAPELLEKTNIRFESLETVVKESEIIFVAVQTPHEKEFEGITRTPHRRVDFDYYYLISAIKGISDVLDKIQEEKTVVIISTVLPGTLDKQILPIVSSWANLVYNPFFIAMGTTIDDFLNPEFVLVGADELKLDCQLGIEVLQEFYSTIHNKKFHVVSYKEAELIKVSYNTFISMKIAYVNMLMEICHKIECNIDNVTDGLKLATDRLISPKYLTGGMGDGGGCHPRDNIAMSWLAKELDLSFDLFRSIMAAREGQAEWIASLMLEYHLPKVILGLAYKPETNLTVGSTALLVKNILEQKGVAVATYEPYEEHAYSHDFGQAVYLIGVQHKQFLEYKFPTGSVVIDPFRYIIFRPGVHVVHVGG